ncbi:MAG: type II secretion system F family protein [Beijerinckiaceae bacterium]|jgi:tight adherence protein B|nr:type II secretion system F family protein [Beijerinckiaceae bacterium]MDO9440443.1 type II secretion system F family protein [Beijerinckiaceae bacterium]
MNTILIVVLSMFAAGAVFYALVYPYLSGEAAADKRKSALIQNSPQRNVGNRASDTASRRKQVADSLKEIEKKGKNKKVSLEQRILQAGLSITKAQFFMWCGIGGLGLSLFLFFVSEELFMAALGLFVGGFGLPRWILSHLKRRRLKSFSVEFPNALDVIIRGVKAGLPLGDCLRIVAAESAEPVKSEFIQIVEAQTMGLTISEAIERIAERVPVAEARFFSIVITIQQKAGGNLSEALGNLSRVLRDRKKMAAKIQAMSSEAKASAGIIAALPFVVAVMVYFTSPRYIELLWLHSTGRVVLFCCAIWMMIGVGVMKKMISFDF